MCRNLEDVINTEQGIDNTIMTFKSSQYCKFVFWTYEYNKYYRTQTLEPAINYHKNLWSCRSDLVIYPSLGSIIFIKGKTNAGDYFETRIPTSRIKIVQVDLYT